MSNLYKYVDENDKCYGITGMVISLNIFDNDEMLQSLSIDSEEGDYITFTPDFYFNGNPRFSAKTAWNEMVKQYQLFTALVMGNVICRYAVGLHKSITQDIINDLHSIIEKEGHDLCSLDDDEIDMLFNKTYNYLSRVYGNRQISYIADGFVKVLKQRRSLTGSEVIEELQLLRRNFM